MTLSLGLQTITWGDPQHEQLPQIIAWAATCGYQGLEVGWRRLAQVDGDAVARACERSGLRLIATHAGGNLEDPDQARSEQRCIDAMLDELACWGAPYLMYSGLRYESDAQLAEAIAGLNRLAEQCRRAGVRLLYHNHDFEFTHGGRVWTALVEDSVPALGFCPDVGWIHKAGEEWSTVLDSIAGRFPAIHFKDFVSTEPAIKDVCRLGEGCVPLADITRWLHEQGPAECWVIAEQDHCQGSAEAAAQANARFLQEQMGAMP